MFSSRNRYNLKIINIDIFTLFSYLLFLFKVERILPKIKVSSSWLLLTMINLVRERNKIYYRSSFSDMKFKSKYFSCQALKTKPHERNTFAKSKLIPHTIDIEFWKWNKKWEMKNSINLLAIFFQMKATATFVCIKNVKFMNFLFYSRKHSTWAHSFLTVKL